MAGLILIAVNQSLLTTDSYTVADRVSQCSEQLWLLYDTDSRNKGLVVKHHGWILFGLKTIYKYKYTWGRGQLFVFMEFTNTRNVFLGTPTGR